MNRFIRHLPLKQSFAQLIILIASSLLSVTKDSNAQSIVQKVDIKASKVSFSFFSKILETEGTLSEYGGTLQIDEAALKPQKISLTAKPSAINFSNLPIEQSFLITGLIKSIPSQAVDFESEAIEPLGGNRYMVVGHSSVGHKSERHTFPVNFTKIGRSLSIVSGAIKHAGLFGNPKDPRALIFGEASGKADFDLKFK